MRTFSTKCDWNEITEELGTRFEIAFNTFKPFACGIVIHPCIDGAVALAAEHRFDPGDVERIELKVHPLVLELTGKTTPRTGLEGKFSVYHATAAGILFGKAGEAEFGDDVVTRPDVVALRDRVRATADAAIHEASADVTIFLRDGRRLHTFVQHAIGSLERPMSDADLARKFHDLVDPVLGAPRAFGADRRVRGARRVRRRPHLRRAHARLAFTQDARGARPPVDAALRGRPRRVGVAAGAGVSAVRRRPLPAPAAPARQGRDVAAHARCDGGADAADGEDHEQGRRLRSRRRGRAAADRRGEGVRRHGGRHRIRP